jgi:hypothetical protein
VEYPVATEHSDYFRIAQPDERMFERNIAHQARSSREVRVVVDDIGDDGENGGSSFVGFWSGMDEAYLQLCKTEGQALVLIDRASVKLVEETGRNLRDIEAHDVYQAQRIRERTKHFAKWADKALLVARGGNKGIVVPARIDQDQDDTEDQEDGAES